MAVNIPLSHQTVKAPGQRVYAVSDWNADHQITSDIDIGAYDFTATNITATATIIANAGSIGGVSISALGLISNVGGLNMRANFQILADSGSEAFPGISWVGDLDTGIRRTAANTMEFVTAGIDRLRIGTTSIDLYEPLDMNDNYIYNTGYIRPNDNNLDDIATAANRYRSIYLGTSVIAGTMTLSSGSITDTSGSISFGNERLGTTGSVDINRGGLAGYHALALTTDTTTTATTGLQRNYLNFYTINPSANTAISYVAIEGSILTPTTNTRNFASSLYGLVFQSIFKGQGTCLSAIGAAIGGYGSKNTGILTNAIGVQARGGALGVGKVTNAYCYLAQPQNTSSGAGYNTNNYGFYLDNVYAGSGIVNAYGLYLEDINYGTTLNYAIYTNAGLIRFGGVPAGATQIGAGVGANELWKTNGHATLPDNVLMIGV